MKSLKLIIFGEKLVMAKVKILIKSNHEDGESIENTIHLNLDDLFFSQYIEKNSIDWSSLNGYALSYPNYLEKVKSEIRKNKIEVPDPNYWTTEGIIIALNDFEIPDDFYLSDIEERIFTGDLL